MSFKKYNIQSANYLFSLDYLYRHNSKCYYGIPDISRITIFTSTKFFVEQIADCDDSQSNIKISFFFFLLQGSYPNIKFKMPVVSRKLNKDVGFFNIKLNFTDRNCLNSFTVNNGGIILFFWRYLHLLKCDEVVAKSGTFLFDSSLGSFLDIKNNLSQGESSMSFDTIPLKIYVDFN